MVSVRLPTCQSVWHFGLDARLQGLHTVQGVVVRLLYLLLLCCCAEALLAEETPQEKDSPVVIELDAYYSNIGLYYHPGGESFPVVESDDELAIYRDLFLRSYIPQDVVLEASIYPMPILGVWLNEQAPGFYEQMQWGEDFNLVQSVTAGFDEPFALSLFLGNVVKYSAGDIAEVGCNKGYMGYLFSVGSKHIKDNTLIDDDWWEFEWKAKGERERDARNLRWSFRIGGKWHDNEEIADTYYLGASRNRLDFDAPVLSWLLNSGVDYQIAFEQYDSSLVEQQLFFNKKLPLRAWALAFNVEFGFIWRKAAKYRGSLAQSGSGEEFFLVLRPQIEL